MAEYQNIFTRIQVVGPAYPGVPLGRDSVARQGKPGHWHLLGRLGDATEVIDPLTVLPAPAQGALAIECRSDDAELAALLGGLEHEDTRTAVVAERALLAALEAGCTAPVGALAQVAEGDHGLEIYLRGLVAAVDGTDAVRLSATGPTSEAAEVGRRLAAELLDLGAADLMGVRT